MARTPNPINEVKFELKIRYKIISMKMIIMMMIKKYINRKVNFHLFIIIKVKCIQIIIWVRNINKNQILLIIKK